MLFYAHLCGLRFLFVHTDERNALHELLKLLFRVVSRALKGNNGVITALLNNY